MAEQRRPSRPIRPGRLSGQPQAHRPRFRPAAGTLSSRRQRRRHVRSTRRQRLPRPPMGRQPAAGIQHGRHCRPARQLDHPVRQTSRRVDEPVHQRTYQSCDRPARDAHWAWRHSGEDRRRIQSFAVCLAAAIPIGAGAIAGAGVMAPTPAETGEFNPAMITGRPDAPLPLHMPHRPVTPTPGATPMPARPVTPTPSTAYPAPAATRQRPISALTVFPPQPSPTVRLRPSTVPT